MNAIKRSQRRLDLHRMHDGIWCALILPRYGNHYLGRGFARTKFAAIRKAIAHAKVPA